MNGRNTAGWQTTLADLSLVLFMITAAAASEAARKPVKATPSKPPQTVQARLLDKTRTAPSPQPGALSVWADGPGAPPLDTWIAQQPRDPRQQFTITVHYKEGVESRVAALAEAERLVRSAGEAGRGARLVIEPGEGKALAQMAFDRSSSD